MAWIPDQVYSFTIARLLEGFLRIDSLIVNGTNMIIGGIDQGVTPLIHPGDAVNVGMTVSNQGQLTDNFMIEIYKDGVLYEISPEILALSIGGTATYNLTSFVMPNANVSLEIRTFHEEDEEIEPILISNGSALSLDCSDLTGWADGDTGTAVSSQATFDGESTFKFDSGVNSAANNDYSARAQDIGSITAIGNRLVISFKTYHDALGAWGGGNGPNRDVLRFLIMRSDGFINIILGTDGLWVFYDTELTKELGTNLVVQDTWQTWTFDYDLSGGMSASVLDVYLDGALVVEGTTDVTTSGTPTDGSVNIIQYGYATDNRITYMDYLIIGDGFA